MSRTYKHCVVGHGLTGTAACKYLATLGEDVILVGPSEGNGAHGACYDEGRIYRILDPLESWALLAERSIENYPKIEAESQVDFYAESGLLIFGVEDDFIKQTIDVAAKMGTKLDRLQPVQLQSKYPWLQVPVDTKLGLLQTQKAGHMSPRKLTQAQLKLATKHGAAYMDANVEKVTKEADKDTYQVVLSNGECVVAENVLIAAGCYSSIMPFLPEEVVVNLIGAQALLAEISAETASRLSGMPAMIYEGPTEEDCMYLLPPILYPDGSWLLKVGPSTAFAPPLKTVADVDAWFQRPSLDPKFEAKALAVLKNMFTGVEVQSWRPLLCVTDTTPNQRAYIDRLDDGWGICTGGNGWAAKSSDEIGFLAAQMMALPGHWGNDPALPREWFRAVTLSALQPTPLLSTALARVEAHSLLPEARATEALEVVTALLAEVPGLCNRPHAMATELRTHLAAQWGAIPTVHCTSTPGGALAPAHPFISLLAGRLNILVIPGDMPAVVR